MAIKNKICISLGLLLLWAQISFSQKMPSDYFEEGAAQFEAENYKASLASFNYFVNHYPKNSDYPRALYNTGLIYYNLKNYDSAIFIMQKILANKTYNEYDKSGGGLMDDPYTNYRHHASSLISQVYYDQKKYKDALYYFSLSDTAYPYLHFCGNEYASNRVHTALRYADIYLKLKNKEKAIQHLLPAALETLVNSSEVVEQLKPLLKKKKNLKQQLDDALAAIYPIESKRDNETYKQYYFKFLNTQIYVPNSFETDEEKFDKAKAIQEIKESDFYKMIESL